jgi:HAD superfamily hydrolase (TIGR01509 family)
MSHYTSNTETDHCHRHSQLSTIELIIHNSELFGLRSEMSKRVEPPKGIIFDMDGVLVDSNPFHLEKWAALLTAHGVEFDPAKLPEQILGQRNDTALRFFFGDKLSQEGRARLIEELEEKFRRAFRPHARPLPGLEPLIVECHRAGIPMAVASSAMAKNVEFVVEALGFRGYFKVLVNGDEVSRPKPDPEIYLKAARQLDAEPRFSVAFEDSYVGIEAAKRAGMKCIGIASSFPAEELRSRTQADLVVQSFNDLSLPALCALFRGTARRPRRPRGR